MAGNDTTSYSFYRDVAMSVGGQHKAANTYALSQKLCFVERVKTKGVKLIMEGRKQEVLLWTSCCPEEM